VGVNAKKEFFFNLREKIKITDRLFIERWAACFFFTIGRRAFSRVVKRTILRKQGNYFVE